MRRQTTVGKPRSADGSDRGGTEMEMEMVIKKNVYEQNGDKQMKW